jgi:hypothetical protein
MSVQVPWYKRRLPGKVLLPLSIICFALCRFVPFLIILALMLLGFAIVAPFQNRKRNKRFVR